MDDVHLLEMLLGAASPQPPVQSQGDCELLRLLLSKAPARFSPLRKLTLFEALDVLDLENPHSDFLAFLLDPHGPLTDNWLLRAIMERVAPDQPWKEPLSVEREAVVEECRLDIHIEWEFFQLIIENKVHSGEGESQIARYLKGASIDSPQVGRIVYLTPSGEWPASVARDDPRLAAMSYRNLLEMLVEALDRGEEPHERGKILAGEYRDGIRRLLKVYEMDKPKIADSTRFYIANARRLAEIKEHALNENSEFLQWVRFEAKRRLSPILGPDIENHWHRLYKGYLFSLPTWKYGNIQFGPNLWINIPNPKKELISEVGPEAGIGVWRTDGEWRPRELQPVVDMLRPGLNDVWPHKEHFECHIACVVLFRDCPVPSDGNLDVWAENTISFLEELTTSLKPRLDSIAAEFAKK